MNEKIKALTEQKNKEIKIKKENKDANNLMFSNIEIALDVDKECMRYCGLNKKEILIKMAEFKKSCKEQAQIRIDISFIETCLKDIDLLFSTIFENLCCFTMNETFNVYRKILSRVEKILAENENFYVRSNAEKNEVFHNQIEVFIPDWQLEYYSQLLIKEKENSFSVYNDFIENVQAQDFILRGSFINIQYDNNENFIIINFPDFLKEINTLFIEHLVINFTYRHKLSFGPTKAILDLEDQGYRFNMVHKELDVNEETSIFIRKNISKGKDSNSSFDYENYYYNLFSEIPNDNDLTKEIIERCNKAKIRLQYKFEGFKSKNYKNIEYNEKWFKETINNPKGTTYLDIAKYALIDVLKSFIKEKNPLIVGPTGSGKSTVLLKVLSEKQLSNNPEQNLITIEDTPELFIPYAISYQTNKNYSTHDIFQATLRQNPSKVIIGETRDKTILDVLENCIVSKSATTIHATDMNKLLMRVKLMAGKEIDTKDLFYLLTSAIDIFVFVIARKITGIYIRNNKHFVSDVIECYDRII